MIFNTNKQIRSVFLLSMINAPYIIIKLIIDVHLLSNTNVVFATLELMDGSTS